ncbi:hypothetical protein Hte_012464 [Hypoxylon texense]
MASFEPDRNAFHDWLVDYFGGLRSTMSAWAWEHSLLTYCELESLREQPCSSNKDTLLLAIIRGWGRSLQELSLRERTSRERHLSNLQPNTFGALLLLVQRLYDLLNGFHLGDPSLRRTPAHHRTIWPNTPRSDVAQARHATAVLAWFGFGTWLENCVRGHWARATAEINHTFIYAPRANQLGWATAEERLFPHTPLPRMSMHLVFPAPEVARQQTEEQGQAASAPVESDTPAYIEAIHRWMDGVTDDPPETPDVPSSSSVTIRNASSYYAGSESHSIGADADDERSSAADKAEEDDKEDGKEDDGNVDSNRATTGSPHGEENDHQGDERGSTVDIPPPRRVRHYGFVLNRPITRINPEAPQPVPARVVAHRETVRNILGEIMASIDSVRIQMDAQGVELPTEAEAEAEEAPEAPEAPEALEAPENESPQ